MTRSLQARIRATCALVVGGVLVSGLGQAQKGAAPEGSQSSISVRLNPKNRKGALACALYASGRGFPGEIRFAKSSQRKRIPERGAHCTFTGLAPGSYAVAVVHDENNNRKLDTNFLGMPTEGWGTTNNVKPLTRAPRFSEAKVELRPGQKLVVAVRLNY